MALINVRVRIVGLYFNQTISIEDNPNLTVRDVLDEYIRLNPNLAIPGGLEYARFPIGNTDYVTRFTYHYDGVYNFDANNAQTLPPDGPSLGNINRVSGIYTLSESLEDELTTKAVGLVWQYYVVSAAGVVKSRTGVARGFQGFGQTPPSYNLRNDDSIIWRLIAIVREPNFM